MSISHYMGSSKQQQTPSLTPASYSHQSIAYPSPHHSLAFEMGKPAVSSVDTRWSRYSQAPSAQPIHWSSGNNYLRPGLLPSHLDQFVYPSLPTQQHSNFDSFQGNRVHVSMSSPMPPTHTQPLSPAASEDLDGSSYHEPTQLWVFQSAPQSPLAVLGEYQVGSHITDMGGAMIGGHQVNITERLGEKRKRSVSDHDYPVLSSEKSRKKKERSVSNHDYAVLPSEKSKKKRHLTKPGDAHFYCQTCGKYFSRVWNYNAHLETHNPQRQKPHVCQVTGCSKAFVRQTDLKRHLECVHEKNKKFCCSLCNNRFARKDTLRRHEDDGCSKRVDIASRTFKGKSIQSKALQGPPPSHYMNFPTSPNHLASHVPSNAFNNPHHAQHSPPQHRSDQRYLLPSISAALYRDPLNYDNSFQTGMNIGHSPQYQQIMPNNMHMQQISVS